VNNRPIWPHWAPQQKEIWSRWTPQYKRKSGLNGSLIEKLLPSGLGCKRIPEMKSAKHKFRDTF
jgi:hypothetical protein